MYDNHDYSWVERTRPSDNRPMTLTEWLGVAFVILWLIWPCQIRLKPHVRTAAEIEHSRQAASHMRNFCCPILGRAQKLGRDYSIDQFYADMRSIEAEDFRIGYPANEDTMSGCLASSWARRALRERLTVNIRFDQQLLEKENRARWLHDNWKAEHCPGGPFGKDGVLGEAIKKAWARSGWRGLGHWFLTFYLRSMLLFSLLALYRARRRDGVTATVQADWKKFAWAILLWPIGLFIYPYNVVREARVEAEVRRKGALWRQLSVAERLTVIQVAASSGYKEWLGVQRAVSARRSLALTLLVTVLLHLIGVLALPKSASADSTARIYQVQMQDGETRAGPSLGRDQIVVDEGTKADCVLPETLILLPLWLVSRLGDGPSTKPLRREWALDHVPILAACGLIAVR